MTQPNSPPRRRWWLWPAGVVALLVVAWFAGARPSTYYQWKRAALQQDLRSPDAQTRQRAARDLIDWPDPHLESFVADQLLDETDATVREAYVYALGRTGNPHNFPAVQLTAELDPSHYVRQAAWVSAALLDPQRFRTLANATPIESEWERIGVAQGWLILGDLRGLDDLFAAARSEDNNKAVVAGRALQKHLTPLLDAAGAWPLDVTVRLGWSWKPEYVDRVAAACERVNLARVAADSIPRRATRAEIERKMKRIMRGRDRIADMLEG